MEEETKYCITAIIIATIWLLGQPISGNFSVEISNFDFSYLNLTDSTISGNIEISGSMPMGTVILIGLSEMLSSDGLFVIYFIVLSMLFLAYVGYYI